MGRKRRHGKRLGPWLGIINTSDLCVCGGGDGMDHTAFPERPVGFHCTHLPVPMEKPHLLSSH